MRQKCSLSIVLIIGLLLFSLASSAEIDEWTKKADIPTGRMGLSASEVGGKIYVIGGMTPREISQTVEEYDPALDRWVEKADMPTERNSLGTAAVKDKIYAIGGMTGGNFYTPAVEEYDPEKNEWEEKNDMIIARMGLATAVVKGRIYAIGGSTGFRIPDGFNIFNISTSATEEYNPVSDRWTQKADMPTARYGLAAAVVKNKIYCIGGMNEDNNRDVLSTVEEYDPALDKWTKKADMIIERTDLAASSVNGKIYAIGGYNKRMFILSTVEEYDTGFTGMSVDAKGKLATSWGEIKIKRP